VDNYDLVLEYLLSEGYSHKEATRIMVDEGFLDFLDAVKQRTGIGKPGVGPGQVVKNVIRAGITDIVGAGIGAGSVPSASAAPTKTSIATSHSPASIVRTNTVQKRTAPKGTNKITTNVWNEPSAPSSRINPSKPSGPKITSTRALSGTNVRGLLPQGVKNVLPDPWKQTTNAVSGARNLWNRVQQAVKPQAQLRGSPRAGQLPQGKSGGSLSNVVKPDIVKSNVKTDNLASANVGSGGVTSSSRPSTSQATQSPSGVRGGSIEPAGPVVDVKASKPSPSTVKPKMSGGGSKLLQGLGALASLRKLTPYGIAAAVMAPRPTADGTLTAARERGEYNPMQGPPAPKVPEKKLEVQKDVAKKTAVAPVVKKPAPAKPVDPRLQKYRDLVKKGKRLEAETLGREIYQSTYGAPAFRQTKTA
jgi:hypothetical protein